jgi:transposase
MDKYIGLDVHASSCTAATIDARGKHSSSRVLETNGKALVEFFKTQAGTLHVCLEEGTQAGWLVEILSPHVAEVVVVHVAQSRGPKSDERDAFQLAERLRTGSIETRVFKDVGEYSTLRQLVKAHRSIVRDTVRAQNRIKALFRARGISTAGKDIYRASSRARWIGMLPPASRSAGSLLFAQYEGLVEVRELAEEQLLDESKRHEATCRLESCPGIGTIRAAQIVSTVVTPERFRTRQQFWSYCGLGIVMRSSADWVQAPNGGWSRAPVQRTRGLNHNYHRLLKQVFKGAAMTVIHQHPKSALREHYDRMLAAGTKPNLAKLTLARQIASTALAMWKKKEDYHPEKTSKSELVSSSVQSGMPTA